MFTRVVSLLSGIMVCALLLLPTRASAAAPVTGRVDGWFTTSGATKLSVDFTVRGSQDGYHYYSLSPFFDGKNYGLYSGIQTTTKGPLFIFSVWDAKSAYPQNGAYKIAFGGEGSGYSLRKIYNWKLGTTYTVTLKREAFDAANNGWRWSSTITDKSTGASLKLGEIPAPAGAATLRTGAVFHERYMGSVPTCGSTTNLEKTSMVASGLSADKPVSFDGKVTNAGVFGLSSCKPFMHMSASKTSVTTGFGMTQSQLDALLKPKSTTKSKQPTKKPAPKSQQVAAATTPPQTGHVDPQAAVTERPQSTLAATTPATLPNTGPGLAVMILAPVLIGLLATGLFYLYRTPLSKRDLRWVAKIIHRF